MDNIEYLEPDNINGLNLYCYCGCNPVMRVDPNGNDWWHWLLGAVAVVAVCALAVVVTVCTYGTGTLAFAVALGALKGAAIGFGIGAAAGVTIGATAGAIYSMATGNDFWTSVGQGALWGLGIGAFAGAIIGAIAGGYGAYSGAKVHSVYISKTDDVVTYVGRTNNISRRTAEHALGKRGIVPQEVANKLTLKQARGLEQALINNFKMVKNGGTLLNKINSISRTNPIYDKAVAWGVKYMSKFLKFLL